MYADPVIVPAGIVLTGWDLAPHTLNAIIFSMRPTHRQEGDCNGLMMEAVRAGNAVALRSAIAAGADVGLNRNEAVYRAASNGAVPMTRILLTAGADPLPAWLMTPNSKRKIVASTLDACADAMTASQRASLMAQSPLFIGMHATFASAQKRRTLHRMPCAATPNCSGAHAPQPTSDPDRKPGR